MTDQTDPIPAIQTVGVVGAGQMGGGIAQVAAQAGYTVRLADAGREKVDAGVAKISKRLDREVQKERLDAATRDAVLDRIVPADDMSMFGDCDLVIEAATEDKEVKRDIFQKLVPNLKSDALLATNTSSISITMLAAVTDRPERFMGVHFMNPVPKMKLVELIRGIATNDAVFETIRELVEKLEKSPAVAADFPGFIVNRVLLPMINEAVYAVHEGVGDVRSIDTALKMGANHPMGPLALADLIGLDTCLSVMETLHNGLGDTKYRPCPLLVKYVEAGWLGRKTGRGFYDYSGDDPVPAR